MSKEDLFTKYITHTYQGKKLLEKYSINEYGVWMIYGEDPNCDFGGSHYEPLLETVEGELADVIRYGVELPKFWQWGSGGKFEKVSINKVDETSSVRRKELKAKKALLEKQLEDINKQLGEG